MMMDLMIYQKLKNKTSPHTTALLVGKDKVATCLYPKFQCKK